MDRVLTYSIDAADRILRVGGEWLAFAEANGGNSLLPPPILGRSLWSMIEDSTTRQVYQALLARVRAGAGPVHFGFRCDAPAERRLLDMRIDGAADGSVEFSTTLRASQPRPEVHLLRTTVPRSGDLLQICGWCTRVPDREGTWLEIEAAIGAHGLFEATTLPTLSHAMCPTCHATITEAIEADELRGDTPVTLGELPYSAEG